MQLLKRGEHDVFDMTVTVAQQTQALAVECVDRAARSFPEGHPTLLGRLWGLQLRATSALTKDPTDVVDDGYKLAERLLALHRQFAQRLFEAMDTRDDGVIHEDPAAPQGLASVTPLLPRRHG